MARGTFAAGLSGEEQLILFNLVVESGAIERIKSIALHEVNQFETIVDFLLSDTDYIALSNSQLNQQTIYQSDGTSAWY